MSSPEQFDALEGVHLPPRPLHLAIGMFDGVHLGHQSVIDSAVHSARSGGGLAGVLTFHPHPSALFRPDAPTRLIMDAPMKLRALAGLGVDFVVEQRFTPEFARIGAREFMPMLRRCLPHLAAVYVGENWRFGRGREGDLALLVGEARRVGVAVFSAPRLNHNGAPISSTRVRALLAEGDVGQANALLGYPYFAEGTVQPGRQLGRKLGFPTLNLVWEPDLRPRFGVYLVQVQAGEGTLQPALANYGVRPTVEQTQRPLLEVHVLGETHRGPGDRVTVHWLRFLRAEKKFDGVEALKRQIAEDRDRALAMFAEMG